MLEISTVDVMSCWCICTADSVYVTVWNDISLWINHWIMDGAIQPGQDWLFRSAGKVLSGTIWFLSGEAQSSFIDWVEKYHGCCSWAAYTCSPLANSSLVDDVILFWLQLKANCTLKSGGAFGWMPNMSYKMVNRKSKGSGEKARVNRGKSVQTDAVNVPKWTSVFLKWLYGTSFHH